MTMTYDTYLLSQSCDHAPLGCLFVLQIHKKDIKRHKKTVLVYEKYIKKTVIVNEKYMENTLKDTIWYGFIGL
jgi:hypothetical protein